MTSFGLTHRRDFQSAERSFLDKSPVGRQHKFPQTPLITMLIAVEWPKSMAGHFLSRFSAYLSARSRLAVVDDRF
jgi:hypothetical protein